MELIHVVDQNKWLALNDEVQIGELLYKLDGDFLIISHTEVEAHYRGNKIAEELVLATVEQARVGHLKIVPECSFAGAVFERYPEYIDMLAKKA